MNLKGIVKIARPPFLLLAVILGFLGASVAWYEHQKFGGAFSLGHALLAGAGLIIAHAGVNIWNDYFDARSKLDFRTTRTPFSGGSGAVPQGILTERQALWLGIATLVITIPIGIYFTIVSGLLLLPLLLVSAILIVAYTPIILKMGYPEWSAGLGLGILPVLGAYFVQTGHYTMTALIASVPSGLLVHNLLLLNELPDVEADKTVGRRTLPIFAGKKFAAAFYSTFQVLTYLWIIVWVMAGDLPAFALLGLLSLPFSFKAIDGSFKYNDMGKLVPAQAANVMAVLLTQLLVGVGFILAGVL